MQGTQNHSERCLAMRMAAAPEGVSAPLAIAYDEAAHFQLLSHSYSAAYDLELKSIAIFEALEDGAGNADEKRAGNYAGNFARYCAAIALIKMGRVDDAENMVESLWVRQEPIFGMMNKKSFK